MARVMVNLQNCKACYYCQELCPKDVFAVSSAINRGGYFPVQVVKEEACNGCMLCYYVCPDFAIGVEK